VVAGSQTEPVENCIMTQKGQTAHEKAMGIFLSFVYTARGLRSGVSCSGTLNDPTASPRRVAPAAAPAPPPDDAIGGISSFGAHTCRFRVSQGRRCHEVGELSAITVTLVSATNGDNLVPLVR